MTAADGFDAAIRSVLDQYGKLTKDAQSLDRDDDLYRHGLTSHASVNVMLALEDGFDVEFIDAMLRRQTFESIAAMAAALSTLTSEHSS